MATDPQPIYTVGLKCGADPYNQLVFSGFPTLDMGALYVQDHCSAKGRPAPSQPAPSGQSWMMHAGNCTYLIEVARKREDSIGT